MYVLAKKDEFSLKTIDELENIVMNDYHKYEVNEIENIRDILKSRNSYDEEVFKFYDEHKRLDDKNTILYEGNPKWYHININAVVNWAIFFILGLIMVGDLNIGFITFVYTILFITSIIKAKNHKLIIKKDMVIYRTGIIRKNLDEIFISDIRNIQVKQGIRERIFGFGNLSLATSATGATEVVLKGFTNVEDLKNMIQNQRRTSK